ncbi:hypothetical protein FB107DRAFT_280405 [Schizophyllum commune]
MKDAEDIAHLFAKARADVADLISGLRHEEALSRRRTIIENLASSLEVTGLVARGHHAYEAQLCERRLEGVHPVASVATQTLQEDIDFLRCIVTSQAHLLVQNGDGLTAEHIFVRPILKMGSSHDEGGMTSLAVSIAVSSPEKALTLCASISKNAGQSMDLARRLEQEHRLVASINTLSTENSRLRSATQILSSHCIAMEQRIRDLEGTRELLDRNSIVGNHILRHCQAAKEKTEQAAVALIELITTQLAEKEERLSDMQKKRFGERQRLEEEAEQIRRTLRGLRPRSVSNSSEEDVMKVRDSSRVVSLTDRNNAEAIRAHYDDVFIGS